jgi:Ca2+-binding RTX toxin-like protein
MGGNDNLSGGYGADTFHGGDGDDYLGFSEPDSNDGNDTMYGDAGADTALGHDGDDTLNMVDGVSGNDEADGGNGTDTCKVDPGDTINSCESGTPQPSPTPTATSVITLAVPATLSVPTLSSLGLVERAACHEEPSAGGARDLPSDSVKIPCRRARQSAV